MKKFVVVALGTFVGVYAALSLFVATHRPPMRPCPMMVRPPHVEHRADFFKGPQGDFHRMKFERKEIGKFAPKVAE